MIVNTCSDYAMCHNLLFNTNADHKKNKSKCLFFGHSKHSVNIKCIMLGNKALPFVANAKHLGNTLDVCDNNKDM